MENDKIIRGLMAGAKDHIASAQMCTYDGKEEELKSHLGQAESLIEKTFDVLNGIKSPPKVSPEELMAQKPSQTSENGSTRLPKCQDDTLSVQEKGVYDGPHRGTIIGTEIERKNRTTRFIGQGGQSGEEEDVEVLNKPDDFGEVSEADVDRAIGKGDSLQLFFSCIAMNAVKGEIVRYKEKKFDEAPEWMQISFVVNMPQSKRFVYAHFLLKEFDRWLDEYGYRMKGTFSTTANRNTYFEVMIADKGYAEEQKTLNDEERKWAGLRNEAETRLKRNGEFYKYQLEYAAALQVEKTVFRNPEDFADISKAYDPRTERELCDGANDYATWLMGKSSELSAVVDAAAISILNVNKRGCDRKPSKSKLARIKPELIAALRVMADRAIVYGLKALALAIFRKLNLAEAILAIIKNGDFTIGPAQQKAFDEGI